MVIDWNKIIRSFQIIGLLFVLFLSSPSSAIFPENIGATQYGTGHLAAAGKLEKESLRIGEELGWPEEKTRALHGHVENLISSKENLIPQFFANSSIPHSERKSFIDLVLKLQEKVSSKSPVLFMIGSDRAVAVDGHHKIRALGKLNEIVEESRNSWAQELTASLSEKGRIRNGVMETSLEFKKPKILHTFSPNIKASKLMRVILASKMGIWADPKDDKLAKKFYGKKRASKASKTELKHLASQLGIKDGPKGLSFTPVLNLPDSPNRTLMGMYFESRGLKDGDVAYRMYVEFYVGDEVKTIAAKNPEQFPNLSKFLDPKTGVREQKKVLKEAMTELDEMFALKKKLSTATIQLASKGSTEVERLLTKIKTAYCSNIFQKLQVSP